MQTGQRPARHVQGAVGADIGTGPQLRSHARAGGTVRSSPPGQQVQASRTSVSWSAEAGVAAPRTSVASSARFMQPRYPLPGTVERPSVRRRPGEKGYASCGTPAIASW